MRDVDIFNNILRQYGESMSRVNAMTIRDPIELQEYEYKVYHPHSDLIGRGNTEEEAHADLQAQVEEIREKHMLRHPFQRCGCIVCEPWNHGAIQS